jgi:hypothetical protein
VKKQDIVYGRLEYMYREDTWIHKNGRREIKQLIDDYLNETWSQRHSNDVTFNDTEEARNISNATCDNLLASIRWQYVTREGKIAKRIRKHYKKIYGVCLPDSLISKIGQIAESHMTKMQHLYFDFTDRFDWSAGDFGDTGSCYWGENNAAREVMQDNQCTAVRFYHMPQRSHTDDLVYANLGYARAWIFNDLPFEGMIIFNAYNMPLIKVTRVLASLFNWDYKRISLYNEGNVSGLVWLNNNESPNHDNDPIKDHIPGGKAYILGKTEDIKGITEWDMEMDTAGARGVDCYGCENHYNEDRMIYVERASEYYCDDCYCERFTTCEDCNTIEYDEDSYYIERVGYSVCSSCFTDYSACEDCHEHVYNEDLYNTPDGRVCQGCIDSYTQCEDCNDYFKDTILTEDDYTLCDSCAARCKECDEPYYNLNLNEMCNECQDSLDAIEELVKKILENQLLQVRLKGF